MFGFNKTESYTEKKEGICILFDIGGTKMRVAASSDGYEFEEPHTGRTPESFLEGIRLFEDLARGAAGGRRVRLMCGGIPGSPLPDRSGVYDSPNLPSWNRRPLLANFSRIFPEATVHLENDAAVVGLGEAVVGAGQGQRIVMYMTISTGVGGARIVDGYIDHNVMGFEPGHQIMDMHTGEDLESMVSGRAIERRFGVKPYDLADREKREQIADELAVGIANSIFHWSPNVVVLGGSLISGEHNTLPMERIEKKVHSYLGRLAVAPRVKKALLQDLGGLHGALVLAQSY